MAGRATVGHTYIISLAFFVNATVGGRGPPKTSATARRSKLERVEE